MPMVTTNLFSHPVFRDGGFTNNDRAYAGSRSARSPTSSTWPPSWGRRPSSRGAAGRAPSSAAKDVRARAGPLPGKRSTCSASTCCEQGYGIRFALEPKPNEPRGDILLPTIGHAMAFIDDARPPRARGAQPEVGHEEMAGLNFASGVAQALWHGKLFHVDLIERADLVVALDYPRLASWPAAAADGRPDHRRQEVCNGNREIRGAVLDRDSLFVWQFTSFRRKRGRCGRGRPPLPDQP